MKYEHKPVMLHQLIAAMINNKYHRKETQIFIDGTFGQGGHSKELLKFMNPKSKLFVFDRDPQAISEARKLSSIDNRVHAFHTCFSSMKEKMLEHGISNNVDGIMLDLGVSSPQIDQAERGFSFMKDGPLDMRMDNSKGLTVSEWLCNASLDDIYKIISKYGEEKFAFKIAKKIVDHCKRSPILTTRELSDCISTIINRQKNGKHPATRTFQALRIYINREIEELSNTLPIALDLLKKDGILAIISFHSIEDRIVKNFFNKVSQINHIYTKIPIFEIDMPVPRAKKFKKILPDFQEIDTNPRSRSAVLRVLQLM